MFFCLHNPPSISNKSVKNKQLTGTLILVWLELDVNRCGMQLERSSNSRQREIEGNISIEDREFLISSLSLFKSDRWGREGRHAISSDWTHCRSAFLRTSGTFGTCVAVYIVNARKRKNPIKCLKKHGKLVLASYNGGIFKKFVLIHEFLYSLQ